MALFLISLVVLVALIPFILWRRRVRNRAEVARYTLEPDQLNDMLQAGSQVLVFDVRLPLDLLADPNVIPGSRRVPPNDLIANPALLPKDLDAVVYCTCPGEETSRKIIRKALNMNFTRVKFLCGGLAAWRKSGFPVEPYTESFHLDTLR